MYLLIDEIDREGCKCRNCKKGRYFERTLQDSWDSRLTCDVCHHSIKRYLEIRLPRMP